MATYEMIVTDVTCYGTLYCVAGWDIQNGRMIRPEPPGSNTAVESSRFWGDAFAGPGKIFSVGNIVRFDAADPPAHFPFPHATEDRILIAGSNITSLRQIAPSQVAHDVAVGLSPSLQHVFGGKLIRTNSGKAYVPAGEQTCSLDAIEIAPGSISFYEENPSPGKRRLRALINQSGLGYDFSVPADAARSRFLQAGCAALQADAAASQRIHVRLGLSRPFPAMPDSCYAQINGLYFL